MQLPGTSLQSMVEEMKLIINEDINFMDSNGTIIASTDKNRIGQKHGGAIEAIRTRNSVIVNNGKDYSSSKEGVNLPIFLKGDIVGVVGITGKIEEIEKFSIIIQKICSIFVKDAFIEARKNILVEAKSHFIKEWINADFNAPNSLNDLEEKSHFVNIDIYQSRRVLLLEMTCIDKKINIINISKRINNANAFIKQYFEEKRNHVFLSNNTRSIILVNTNHYNIEYLVKLFQQTLKKKLLNDFKITLNVGIGSVFQSPKDLKKSYNESNRCLDFSKKHTENKIICYDDLHIEHIINELPIDIRNKIRDTVFSKLNEKDIELIMSTIDSYFNYNGSINQASEAMHLHKNTYQYRIKKLSMLTGYNLRNLQDAIFLYLAYVCYKMTPNNSIS